MTNINYIFFSIIVTISLTWTRFWSDDSKGAAPHRRIRTPPERRGFSGRRATRFRARKICRLGPGTNRKVQRHRGRECRHLKRHTINQKSIKIVKKPNNKINHDALLIITSNITWQSTNTVFKSLFFVPHTLFYIVWHYHNDMTANWHTVSRWCVPSMQWRKTVRWTQIPRTDDSNFKPSEETRRISRTIFDLMHQDRSACRAYSNQIEHAFNVISHLRLYWNVRKKLLVG